MKIVSLVESFLSSKQELVDSKVTSTNFFYPSTSTSTSEFSSSSTSRIYRELKQECLNQNRLFIDSEFPPNNESLFLDDSRWSGTDLEIEWKRPGEIVDDPKLFVEGASPFDVTQGILGNCWFVSACSALTNSDALLCKVIPDGQEWGASGNTYAGIFQFCFWRYGRWVDIIIDDLLPCKGGKLLFAHSKTDNEFWSALLEKAFAKFYGCYENLVGGQLADALQDVSGGVVETHYVRRFMYQHTKTTNSVNNTNDLHVPKVLNNTTNGNLTSLSVYKADFTASKRLFYALKHAFNRNALIVAAISAKNEEVEKSLDCGLVMGHAYAITSIQFIELDALQLINRNRTDRGRQSITMRQAMVRLQNPWGEKEWNGPWSDGASEWDQITSEQKHRLGITDNEDGEFWMPWEEFLKYFTDISVCQLLMPLESGISGEKVHISLKASRRSNATGPMDRRYYEWDFYGCWTTNNVKSGAPLDRSGGCPNFAATFCFNPQFLFEVPGQGSAEVIFALNKPDLFLGKKKLSYLAAGMQLIRVERNRRHRLHRPLPNTATSEYSSGRSVLLHLDKLPPGRYILIVSSFAPREIGEFLVRIYATQRLNPCPLENDTPVAALCKFGLRIRCLIRLHILEVIIPSYNQRKGGLFCLLTTSTGERIRTIGAVHLGPKLSFKFNGECFIFHSLCPSMRFTFEIFEKNFPFRLGNKYLGRAKILVNADQNDRIRFDLALRKPSYNHSFVMASLLFSNVVAKRRTGSKNRPFDARPGMGGLMKEDSEDKNVAEESAHLENISWKNIRSGTMSIKNTYETVNKKINVDMIQKKNFEEELAMKIIDSGVNFTEELYVEDKEIWRNLSALPGAGEKNIFWIDATFKAVDLGINISGVSQCITWHHFWETKDNSSNVERLRVLRNRTIGESSSDELVRYEVFERGDRLLQLIPSSVIDELFDNEGFEAIGILWQEICGEHKRDFFYTSPEDAKAIGIDNGSIICEPFRKELHPDISTLINLEKRMTKLIGWNFTYEDENNESNTTTYLKKKVKSRQIEERNQIAKTEEEMEEAIRNRTESATASKTKKPVEVDVSDETSPLLVFSSAIVSDALGLRIAPLLFHRHQRVGLALQGICSDYIPTAIEAFNVSEFEGIEIEGPIGVNISALENAGVNLTELAEKLRNDTEVDDILSRTTDMDKQVGGSFILPVLTKNQYDPFSPPIVFQGSAVVVRFGIYIESISNFQTSTMDYDMDIYLMMSWRDPRLVSGLTTILVKEEEIMEKIWRPDPFFDVKEAEFHEVTFLNFLMRIFNDGLVLYETRIKLKPACNLVLCKYPHDKQTCELKIKSFAYPLSAVRFEWFSNRKNAIDKNPEVRLPELYIDNYEPAKCNKSRKSGEFACLRAIFRLKRDVGFHIAQTYIPTSLALMFSWVGVWLPEEFMEGRIGVAITVLLTLSTESAGAREHLPSVSYLKAIDLWFGFVTGFVFFTLLQTLFVIGFDKRANQLRKWAQKKRRGTLELSREAREDMSERADHYHKIGRYLDNCCRVFYPLSFALFLILYYFILTEGRQDDCFITNE